jgi:hypothetical protein
MARHDGVGGYSSAYSERPPLFMKHLALDCSDTEAADSGARFSLAVARARLDGIGNSPPPAHIRLGFGKGSDFDMVLMTSIILWQAGER